MPISKVRKYNLVTEIERLQRENPPVSITISDTRKGAAKGETVDLEVKQSVLWTDDQLQGTRTRPVEVVRELVGDDELYDMFVAQGGTANILLTLVTDTEQGASAGE